MSRRKKSENTHWPVVVEHALTPDAPERLRRTFDLILRAGTRATEQTAEQPAEESETERSEDEH